MLGERLVGVGEVAVEQRQHAEVVARDGGEERRRLFVEGRPQRAVPDLRVATIVGVGDQHVAEAQPLRGEVVRERATAVGGEQAAGVRREAAGRRQFAAVGRGEQRVVGRAGGEQVAEAAGEFVVGEARGRVGAADLGAQQERRRREHRLQHRGQRPVVAAGRRAHVVAQRDAVGDLVVVRRSAECATQQLPDRIGARHRRRERAFAPRRVGEHGVGDG